ncbi:MAG: efflux RND transporter periplasmic adaptor subunit, partial [Clostridiales bacterium]|nr:efflux RND transporter periplasmic adaptor subunit [Clostridiales bacterium]
ANLLSAKKRAVLQVSSAQGQVNSVGAQLGNTRITAPISGILNQTLIETGEMAIAGKPIANIVNVKSIKIELAVTEFDIGRISNGQEVKISLSAYPEEEFLANIYYVGLVADPVSKKFPIKVQISNEDKKIKAGMVAQIKILSEEQKDVLVIPKTAIFTEGKLEKIYVVDENQRIKIAPVKTESINEDTVIVEEGLSENDMVVINGNYELKEGVEVNIINN